MNILFRNIFFTCLIGILRTHAIGQVYPHTDPNNAGAWILNTGVSDEFETEQLDTDKWFLLGVEGNYTDPSGKTHWKGRAPSQYSGNNVEVRDGELFLSVRWDSSFNFYNGSLDGYTYGYDKNGRKVPLTAACILSNASFHYGYMEIRCKAADGPVTSAYWTTGGGGEIDVFEHYGYNPRKPQISNRYHSSFHDWRLPVDRPGYGKRIWTNEHYLPFRVADDYHVYALEWDEDYVKIFVDSLLIRCVTREEMGDAWVAYNPQRVWLDMETFYWEVSPEEMTEGDFPGEGRQFIVDYVRIWQRNSESDSCRADSDLLVNGGFEEAFDGWKVEGTAEISSTQFLEGSNSAFLSGKGKISQELDLDANTSYMLSAWINLPGTNMANIWHQAFMGIESTHFTPVIPRVTYFHNYFYRRSIQFETGPDPGPANVYVETINPEHRAYLDRIELVELGELDSPAVNSNALPTSEKGYQIFPNPVSDLLHIHSTGTFDAEIYNVTGKLVRSSRDISTSISIPVDDLPEGIYMLRLSSCRNLQFERILII